jgi:ribosomal protein S18 acetylase RimI-like enzyme
MTVRPATPADAAAIAQLHLASWRTAYRGALPDAYLDHLDLDERTRVWRERLAEPGTSMLLREEASALLGFCAMGPTQDVDADPSTTWEIYNLHVTPERKRTGIGGELFDLAAAHGREQARTHLTLWVVRQNVPARRFYQMKGMEPDGAEQTHPLAPGASLWEVRYRMALGSSGSTPPGSRPR